MTARRDREAYDAAADAVAARSWHPEANKYGYTSRIDAFTDQVAVATAAPPEVRDALAEKFPGLVRIDVSDEPTRLLTGPRSISLRPIEVGRRSAARSTTAPPVRASGSAPRPTGQRRHCGANGTVWNAGGDSYGFTNARPDYPNTDVARVATSTYSPTVYDGGLATSSFLGVVGAGDPSGAIAIRASGRNGSISATVTDLSASFTDADGTTTGLFSATAGAQGGDSGGAVHTVSGSSAGVRGTVVATNGVRDFHQKWSRISAQLGVAILT